MSARQAPARPPVPGAYDLFALRPARLPGEHAELLGQLAVRAGAVLTATSAGRWPGRELRSLLGYMNAEVLRQATDEEELLFKRGTAPEFSELARGHARLRTGIELLERVGSGDPAPERLASAVGDLLCQFVHHVAIEDAALANLTGPGGPPAVAVLGGRPHDWYALTEGPFVDLDALPPAEAPRAAADRVLRLRRGESVELRSGSDPDDVWRLVGEIAPGSYGFAYLEDGPVRWRVKVTHREL